MTEASQMKAVHCSEQVRGKLKIIETAGDHIHVLSL
jgi:hypothetical protein